MKRCLTIGCSLLLIMTGTLYAQDPKTDLESLKAPTMPAATIIGSQPNEVNRPKSMKSLETAILSNYLDANQSLVVPNNYALEFNPFMLSGRKNFDYKEYLENDILKNLWRNLSLSVSSTTKFVVNDTTAGSAMGFGLRTMVLNGRVNPALESAYKNAVDLNQFILTISTNVRALIGVIPDSLISMPEKRDWVIRELAAYYKEQEKTSENNKLFSKAQDYISYVFNKLPADTKQEELESSFTELFDADLSQKVLDDLRILLDQVKNDRYGWRLELNYAHALSFPTGSFDYSIAPGWGLWANLSWRPATRKEKVKNGMKNPAGTPKNIEFIALGRIIKNNADFLNRYQPADTSFKTGTIADLGARIAYGYRDFSVEFEYIHRFDRNKIIRMFEGEEYSRTVNNDSDKYMLNVNYNVSDNFIISYNIGKGFDNMTGASGNLISGLSLNFGFGNLKAEDLMPKK